MNAVLRILLVAACAAPAGPAVAAAAPTCPGGDPAYPAPVVTVAPSTTPSRGLAPSAVYPVRPAPAYGASPTGPSARSLWARAPGGRLVVRGRSGARGAAVSVALPRPGVWTVVAVARWSTPDGTPCVAVGTASGRVRVRVVTAAVALRMMEHHLLRLTAVSTPRAMGTGPRRAATSLADVRIADPRADVHRATWVARMWAAALQWPRPGDDALRHIRAAGAAGAAALRLQARAYR